MDIRKWLKGAAPSSHSTTPTDGGEDLFGEAAAEHTLVPVASQELPASENGQRPPSDLGRDHPNQVMLQQYPVSIFGSKKRAFVSSWYHKRDWLEYSVEADAAFCFCCREFNPGRRPSQTPGDTFVAVSFLNWKNAVERD